VAKITKMQQRRGLRRDLPVPLAPGELALTTDTRELFIGNETSDVLSGVHNKILQIGSFLNGSIFAENLLNNNITEFIVKRNIISSTTGVGPFTILSLHSGLSQAASGAIDLEAGINDQTLLVYKYSPANHSHALLKPSDLDGSPPVIADYKIAGSNQIEFTTALVSTDIVYVVHINKRDLEKHLIISFNNNYDLGNNAITDVTLKLSTEQLYFDSSTGEGFVGFNDLQITQNHPIAGSPLSGSNKPVKDWFDVYVSSATSAINSAISGLGNLYWGDGDGTTAAISNTGGRGVAKFGDDAETSVPSYVVDGDLGFPLRSHTAAVNMSTCFNHIWLAEGTDPTKQLSHVRSNVKVLTDSNIGDAFADIAIGNPTVRTLGTTGAGGTNPVKGTQVYRAVGSSATTTQVLMGVVYFNALATTSIYLSYTLSFDNDPTYYVMRVGQASASMPTSSGANPSPHGHGLILDTWNELDILDSTGAIPFSAADVFELGIVVTRKITIHGDPVIENDHATLSNADFQTKYGTTDNVIDSQVFYVDRDTLSPTYQQYFGFLLYKNTRVSATIKSIQERF